jgi:hypothetical protein
VHENNQLDQKEGSNRTNSPSWSRCNPELVATHRLGEGNHALVRPFCRSRWTPANAVNQGGPVRTRELALTGPAAAALMNLDGFRDLKWTPAWCSKHPRVPGPDVIQTRRWLTPIELHGHVVAHPILVLRHLGRLDLQQRDGISARDRVELALEHCLRDGLIRLDDLRVGGGSNSGDQLIREILRLRGREPATESYAETRWVQCLRANGLRCWRQFPILDGHRIIHRVDTVVPFDQRRKRPVVLLPSDGVLVEVDSRKFHEDRFEEDHQRESNYDRLAFHWISLTPNQVEHQPAKAILALHGAIQKSQRTLRMAA